MTKLTEAKQLLVRRWGEMGGYWGINRTMAEIHALLFVTREPLCTDDVMRELHVSRGNASMNLRALVDWGLIQRVHKFGDRKEYFVADADVWHMFETIMRERRRREVEPIINSIDRCVEMVGDTATNGAGGDPPEDVAEFNRRINDLRQFLSTMSMLFELVLRFGKENIEEFAEQMLQLTPPGEADDSAASKSDGRPTPPRPHRKGGKAKV